MPDAPLKVVVITPEHQVLDAHADAVVVPAHDGELGVLRDRAPLMCELGIGELRYTEAGRTHRLFIDGGFAQVYQNNVIVLTSYSLTPQQITSDVLARAEKAAATEPGTGAEARTTHERDQRRLSALRKLASEQ